MGTLTWPNIEVMDVYTVHIQHPETKGVCCNSCPIHIVNVDVIVFVVYNAADRLLMLPQDIYIAFVLCSSEHGDVFGAVQSVVSTGVCWHADV